MNLLVKSFRWDFIQLSQICVDHDLAAANQIDPPLDDLDGEGKTAAVETLPGRHTAESSKRSYSNESLWLHDRLTHPCKFLFSRLKTQTTG